MNVPLIVGAVATGAMIVVWTAPQWASLLESLSGSEDSREIRAQKRLERIKRMQESRKGLCGDLPPTCPSRTDWKTKSP